MKKQIIALTLLLALGAQADEKGFKSIFNGKDLTGWKNAKYSVEDGVLVSKGGNLVTEKQYSNYVFKFDFLLPPGGNNGLGIHYPGKGDAAYSGMELQILDNTHPKYSKLKDYQYHGSLYTLQAAKRGHLKPVGQWNKQEIRAEKNLITVILNGVRIVDRADVARYKKPAKGHICFLGHGSQVEFRNIRIKDLSPPKK